MIGTDKRLGRASRLRVDETGNKYGRLTVIGYAGWDKASGYALWKCRCDCGKETVVRGLALRQGNTRSCGCLRLALPVVATIRDNGGNESANQVGTIGENAKQADIISGDGKNK